MGLYRKSIRFLEKMIVEVEINKNRYSEKKAIKKKAQLYKDIQWSENEEKCFRDYWISNYGRTINDSYHKLYQSINGAFDEKYFPDNLYSIDLEWRINPKAYCDVFSDKNLLSTLFSIDGLYIPYTYLSCANSIVQDNNGRIITKEKATEILSNIRKAVIKPTVDSCSGHNVLIVDIQNGIDTRTEKKMDDILSVYGKNYVIQELISPCNEIKKLSPHALSTFRVMTYITDSGIYSAPLSMRIGTGKSDVDNIHAGGLVVGVNKNGTLKKYAYRLGYGDNNEKVPVHPDSGVVFENYQIPMVPEMLGVAKKLHSRIPQLGIISWDLTINAENKVTLIEANTRDQAVWFPQMVNGESIFGDNTDYFLHYLRSCK